MKKILLLAFMAVMFINVSAQELETYSSAEYKISFQVPKSWKTTTSTEDGIPTLESYSPDSLAYMMILVYKDATLSTEQMFNEWMSKLEIKIEGKPTSENLNGMRAVMGLGSGVVSGVPLVYHLTAATFEDNNYVCYLLVPAEYADKYADTLGKIVESLTPIKR